jgi:hypothetical protein
MRTPRWLSLVGLSASLVIAANFGGPSVLAADADKGNRIAQSRCAPCHIVVPIQRQELAKSPPFDQIARRNDFNAEMLAYLILGPHPRMNMALSREEVGPH